MDGDAIRAFPPIQEIGPSIAKMVLSTHRPKNEVFSLCLTILAQFLFPGWQSWALEAPGKCLLSKLNCSNCWIVPGTGWDQKSIMLNGPSLFACCLPIWHSDTCVGYGWGAHLAHFSPGMPKGLSPGTQLSTWCWRWTEATCGKQCSSSWQGQVKSVPSFVIYATKMYILYIWALPSPGQFTWPSPLWR